MDHIVVGLQVMEAAGFVWSLWRSRSELLLSPVALLAMAVRAAIRLGGFLQVVRRCSGVGAQVLAGEPFPAILLLSSR